MSWGRTALSLLLPTACAGCEQPMASSPASTLCGDCLAELPRTLAAQLRAPELCQDAFWWAEYASPTGQALRRAKYRPDLQTLDLLSEHLAEAARGRLPQVDAVAPVPQTPQAWLQRGFSPAQRLALACARSLDRPLIQPLARGWGQAQAGRSPQEREQNVRGAFRARGPVHDIRVLLVDDILTTGATASACAQTLLNAGAASVVLLAATRAS